MNERFFSKTALGIAAAAAGVFILFVYGFPRIFPYIEKADPANYRENVADALAAGNKDKALKIARQVAQVSPNDPGAVTTYGTLLLDTGDAAAAEARFREAIAIAWTPPPKSRPTRLPFYYAPARLALGKLAAERGALYEAIGEFEFSRPYADLSAADCAGYRAVLYRTYREASEWPRALEFGEASDADLSASSDEDLSRLCCAAEGRQRWETLLRAAQQLSGRNSANGTAAFYSGRSLLASGRAEQARAELERAASDGHPDAPFFLGLMLESAGETAAACQAYRDTGADSVYRPFAVAMAVVTAAAVPGPDTQALLAELDQYISRQRKLGSFVSYEGHARFRLTAMDWSSPLGNGFLSPVVSVWEEQPIPGSLPPQDLMANADFSGVCVLKRHAAILQLEWPNILLPFTSFDRLSAGSSEIPGWYDAARASPEGRGQSHAVVKTDPDGTHVLEIANDDAEVVAALSSAPVFVRYPGAGCVVAVQARGSRGPAAVRCEALDEEGEGVFSTTLSLPVTGEWQWFALYLRPQVLWRTVRFQVGFFWQEGVVTCRDVMILGVSQPKL